MHMYLWRSLVLLSTVGILLLIAGCLPASEQDRKQTAASYLVLDYGAVGDGQTLNTAALQRAIDAAHAAGGGRVVVPKGTFVSGTLFLKDSVELHLQAGATLLGSPRLADYPVVELQTIRSYTERYSKKAFVYAEGARGIALTGSGTLDGNSYAPEFEQAGRDNMTQKPLGLKLVSCQGVRIEGITLQNAGLWLQHYLNCEDLTIRSIRAINHGHFTNDGMNIDGCRRVYIEGVEIDSHDDALAFKSTGPALCEDVVVRNCTLRSHCHALKFGTETTGGFRKVDIRGIKIGPSDSLHYKAGQYWRVITGVALEMVDGGVMENIHIEDLEADSVYAPIFVKLGNRARKHREDAPEPGPGRIEGITLRNFRITDAGPFASSVTGFPGHSVRDVRLENIDITYNEAPADTAIFDSVPENETRYPEITMFTKGQPSRMHLPAYGLFARHVVGLELENFQVRPAEGEPRDKFRFIDVTEVQIRE